MKQSAEPPAFNQAKLWRESSLDDAEFLRAKYRTHSFPPHEHAEYGIGFIEQGSQAFTLNRSTRLIMPAGSVCVINPGELHEGSPATEAGWDYRMMYVSSASLQVALSDSLDDLGGVIVHFPDSVIHDDDVLSQLRAAHLCSESRGPSALEKSTRLTVALKELTRRYAQKRHQRPPSTVLPGAVKRAREYIDACISSNPSLGEIAEVAGMSPYHFLRAFKRYVGMAPHAYLIQRRVEIARHLLVKGRPIRSIAIALGYSDQAHLSREFRRFYGASPSKVVGNY